MRLILFSYLALLLVLYCRGVVGDDEEEPVVPTFFMCDSPLPNLLGEYKISTESMDGVHVFSNEKGTSFFRNKGFWYLGDLEPWPPVTYYRCVELEG